MQEFYSELDSMLELEPNTIRGDERLADLPGWDSMSVISFIALADTKFKKTVAAKAIAEARTVADLSNLFPGEIV
jgi:acyl carrier protein